MTLEPTEAEKRAVDALLAELNSQGCRDLIPRLCVLPIVRDVIRSLREPTAKGGGALAQADVEITPEAISAGVSALRGLCPFDLAFPVGGEDEAVEAVLRAGLSVLIYAQEL